MPQHGFARTSKWEYLGKSSTDADSNDPKNASATSWQDKQTSVRLDFGLTTAMISSEMRAAWPYKFSLQYSVTLAGDELRTALGVRNEGDAKFDFQTLLHTYLRVPVRLPAMCVRRARLTISRTSPDFQLPVL